LLQGFIARIPHGSKIHILSEKPPDDREKSLEGLALSDVEIHHHIGNGTRREDLERLPIDTATSAVVLADIGHVSRRRGGANALDAGGGEELQITDSETIICVEQLQQLRAGVAVKVKQPLVVVAEVLDILTFRLFQRDAQLLASDFPAAAAACRVTPFHRKQLESSALCASTLMPSLGMFLEALVGLTVTRRGRHDILRCSVVSFPVEKFLGLENGTDGRGAGAIAEGLGSHSYRELAQRASEKDLGVVLGWVRPHEDVPIQVNPRNKSKSVHWRRGDEVIVVNVRVTEIGSILAPPTRPSLAALARGDR